MNDTFSSKLLPILILLALLTGCARLPSAADKAQFNSFQTKFLPAITTAIKTLPFAGSNKTYTFSPSGEEVYDLRVNDDPATPLLGKIDLKIASANWGDGTVIPGLYHDIIFSVAFQNGSWQVTSVALRSNFRFDDPNQVTDTMPRPIKPEDGFYSLVTVARQTAVDCQK